MNTTQKIEKALQIISAPIGTYDPSTVQAAREILMAAIPQPRGTC